MDSLHSLFYWNRLKLLQSLCSPSFASATKQEEDEKETEGKEDREVEEETKLQALVFIPGPDGRNNPMATQVIKYLFKGSIGSDLLDDTLEPLYESLEDMILIIQEDSLRIVCTEEMKKPITSILSIFNHVIEYHYYPKEEEDIDQFQLKKCFHFKKCMLEVMALTTSNHHHHHTNNRIGIAVPIGYENILDIESWPLLQSFALDEIFTATGFFTARYHVVDITTQLETIFRTVDCFYIENAANVVNGAINQHMSQFFSVLDATSVGQRDRLTAEDAISPLEILYEFGEMDAATALEQSLKPALLFGPFSNFLGNSLGPKASKWREFYPANSLHAVIEASEPVTGLRWCRTYFLQQGTSAVIHDEVIKLQSALSGISIPSLENSEVEESLQELKKLSSVTASLPSSSSLSALQRLMSLYVKLWFNLRTLVFEIFLQENDVLAAAETIQQRLTDAMSISNSSSSSASSASTTNLEAMNLYPHEKLQLHMDCLNALGEIINVEDVDDMGGVCWTYIRASIHGIKTPFSANQETAVTIAVGDTFLFAPLCKGVFNRKLDWRFSRGNLLPFVNDTVCITHSIPYFQAFIGSGIEEEYSKLVQYCSKTSLTSSPLNLGKPIEIVGTNSVNVIVLTNHSIHPYFTSELKLFQEGFIITKINHLTSVPIAIHYNNEDVHQIWTIDTSDCFEESLRTLEKFQPAKSQGLRQVIYPHYDQVLPRGILIILELKNRTSSLTALHQALPTITLQSAFTASTEAGSTVIALLFPHNDQSGSMVPNLLERWRPSFRMNDIEELKGKPSYSKINREILFSYLVFLDSLQLFSPSVPSLNPESASFVTTIASKAREILGNSLINTDNDEEEEGKGKEEFTYTESEFSKIIKFVDEFSLYGYPAYGLYPMRCMHAVGEARRLSNFDYQNLLFPSEETKRITASASPYQILVFVGLSGSGINIVSRQLTHQLFNASVDLLNLTPSKRSTMLETVQIDLTKFINEKAEEISFNSKESDGIDQLLISFLKEELRGVTDKFVISKSANAPKPVLILTIIYNPIVIVPFSTLLDMIISITHAPIVQVTSIITPENILPVPAAGIALSKKTRNDEQKTREIDGNNNNKDETNVLDLFHGIGQEEWNSKGFELLHYYSSQSVILLESTVNSPAYHQIKQYIEQYQYNLVFVMKVSSFNLFFEEEDIQYYQQILFPSISLPVSNASAELIVKEGNPVKVAFGIPTFEELLKNDFEFNSSSITLYGNRSKNHLHGGGGSASASSYPFLQTISFTSKELFSNQTNSSNQGAFFSLTLFLKLLQKLFPSAVAMYTNITYDWEHRDKRPDQSDESVPLFLKYAMKKVFQQTEFKEMNSQYQTRFAELIKQQRRRTDISSSASANTAIAGLIAPSSSLWDAVQSNIISLQAIITLDNERIQHHKASKSAITKSSTSNYRVLLEANRGTIIYRELPENEPLPSSNFITMNGTFYGTKEEEDYLLSLFQLTQQYYLSPKPFLQMQEFLSDLEANTVRGLSSNAPPPYDLQKVFKIQNLVKYQRRPLPPGFWFNGQFFIDHNGQHFELRPDTDEILTDYIQEENKKRAAYNQRLEQLYL